MRLLINILFLSLLASQFFISCKPKNNGLENKYIKPDSIYGDISDALKSPESCKHLILRNVLPSGKSLTKTKTITSDIRYLTNLKSIEIYGLSQNEIPIEITELTHLVQLRIEGYGLVNNAISLPDLTNCRSLKKLIINDCHLESLPNLPGKLKYLEATSNSLSSIPTTLFISNITHINLSKNKINALETQDLNQSLKYLNLSENNLIEWPEFFDKNLTLDFLGVSKNPINEIAPNGASITRLEAIQIDKNLYAPLLSNETKHAWLTDPGDAIKDSLKTEFNSINFYWYNNSSILKNNHGTKK
jgi:hypothetical protein